MPNSIYGPGAPVVAPGFAGTAPFVDPFADLASINMPISTPAMLRHAEFFAVTNETLRAAYNRISAYFLTDVELTGDIGDDEVKKQKEYWRANGLYSFLHESGIALLVYGMQLTSVMMPFTRYLACPRCRAEYRCGEFVDPSQRKRYRFEWRRGYHGTCPACNFSGMFADEKTPPRDVPDDSRPLILKSWNPHDIRIEFNSSTDRAEYFYWLLPADFRTDVKMGYNESVLCNSPWEHILAALNDQNIRMDSDYVHYWHDPILPGLRFRGIGVPRAIINYRQIYYTQILRRMNEVLALGHVVPIRVISPANTSGRGAEEGDILKTGYLGNIRGQVMRFVANHRADPNSIHFSPIPLQLQSLGADARQLIPADLINNAQETLLNGSDVPVEFFKMSMQTQTAPVALRLLRQIWSPFVDGRNQQLSFIARRAQFLLGWEAAQYAMADIRLVDAIELQQLKTQMAQAGLLSRSTALKGVGEDFTEETLRKGKDLQTEQHVQADLERENDAFSFGQALGQAQPAIVQAGGQAPPGGAGGDPNQQSGAPAGAAPGMPPGSDPLAGLIPQPGQKIDPAELTDRARKAAQFLITLADGDRYTQLKRIREANPDFHKLVNGFLDELRSQQRSQGQKFMQQQAQQGGQSPGGP